MYSFKKYGAHTGPFTFLRSELDPKTLFCGKEGHVILELTSVAERHVTEDGLRASHKPGLLGCPAGRDTREVRRPGKSK